MQSIVQVPKYDFYIIASQKGIICQWSSKVLSDSSIVFFANDDDVIVALPVQFCMFLSFC